MNDRIKELEQQCWEVRQYNPPWFNATKFAELIVRECADVATINAHQWASPGTYVLKHFGVEE